MAATAPEGTTGRSGARWRQSHLEPGANGKAKPLGGTEDHQNCLESEEVEQEEVILDIESESWPEPEVNHHQSWSHAEAPEPTEDDPMDHADEDPEIEAIKAQARELEDEVDKLKELQKELSQQMNMCSLPENESPRFMSFEEKMKADSHSIYVGNVDYRATAEELKAHFYFCGSINRVTILRDKFNGRPKGFAYIEFSDMESARASLSLDDSLFRGRLIKVNPKRTNRPGMNTTHRGFPRVHYRGCTTNYSARSQSYYSSRSQSYQGFHSRCQGHIYRGGRGRATSWYSPY
ncbi:polyadenylate-binding protein 2-like [Echinops telfairi]|uniref:Polyadenylate-binding protein 2-like n=1 Tax=Echinops telfairi TaxID=9371 RepID=A0ABM0ZQM1_ECHTE|nr:polyadenylate-binding protein 2-like [Echinops telfairi]